MKKKKALTTATLDLPCWIVRNNRCSKSSRFHPKCALTVDFMGGCNMVLSWAGTGVPICTTTSSTGSFSGVWIQAASSLEPRAFAIAANTDKPNTRSALRIYSSHGRILSWTSSCTASPAPSRSTCRAFRMASWTRVRGHWSTTMSLLSVRNRNIPLIQMRK